MGPHLAAADTAPHLHPGGGWTRLTNKSIEFESNGID